jgi:hypothetical protein
MFAIRLATIPSDVEPQEHQLYTFSPLRDKVGQGEQDGLTTIRSNLIPKLVPKLCRLCSSPLNLRSCVRYEEPRDVE